MQRLEVTTALLSPTMRSSEEARRALLQHQRERMRTEDIELEDDDDEERFLTSLQEKLLAHMDFLDQSFLVLRAKQINYVALRLHEALEPKRDDDTQLIQAWTIQPQSQMKIKMSTHIQVLKLSTIFREVQCLRLHQQSGLRSAIEMEIFPSLRSIEVLQTQITALRNVHYFARQLRFLHIEQTDMDALREILSPLQQLQSQQSQSRSQPQKSHTSQQQGQSATASDHSAFVAWRCLETLQINCCALRAVDASVNQLQAIKHLDLGWNRIETFDVALETTTLDELHLCHNKLREVPPIQSLRRLRELDLSVNKITSLRGLETLTSLQVLDVSHNQIGRIADIELLVRLRKLRRLVLQHNPIARRPDYRREVLFYLGEGVELDHQPWSAPELQSMKCSRQLRSPIASSSVSWGDIPSLSLSLSLPTSSSNSSSSTLDESADKFVLSYPVLPVRRSGVTPHLVEIRRAASSPFSSHQQQRLASSALGSRTASSSRLSTSDAGSEQLPYSISEDGESGDAGREPFRTVDDFFTTQGDFIVVLDTHLVDARVEHTDSSDDGDSDLSESETGRRSRKYTSSDFMRDFEEEESLIRDGAAAIDVRVPMMRAGSSVKRGRQMGDGALSVRILLGADEARRYDLHFGIDGIPATLELLPNAIVESIRPSDRETPLCIHRTLADLVAIGSSIHSNRAKIVTLKLRTPASRLLDVTYQIDSAGVLERVLATVFGYLHYQHKATPVICVCAHCGAVSHLSREFIVHFAPATSLSSGAADPFVVYACLLCGSYNVRETAFDKMVAVYAADGVALSAKRMEANSTPEKLADDGFYIEEHEPSAAEAAIMYECVLISSHGVREVMVPTAAQSALEDIPNDAREEAVVQAMRRQ